MSLNDKRRPQGGTGSRRRQGRRRQRRPGPFLVLGDLWRRLLDHEAFWMGTLLLVGSWILTPAGTFFAPRLEVGTIASRDYHATRDLHLLDEETTREKQQRARDGVRPVYDYAPSVARLQDDEMARLFSEGRDFLSYSSEEDLADSGSGDTAEDLIFALQTASAIKVIPEHTALLRAREFSTELEDRLRGVLGAALRDGVVDNKALLLENRLEGVTLRDLQSGEEVVKLDLYDYRGYPDEVEQYVASEVRRWPGWSAADRATVQSFLLANIPPNIYLNRTETQASKEAAAEAEGESFTQVREGQVIVRKGDEIDERAVRVMNEMVGNPQSLTQVLPLLGNLLLLSLVTLALWLGMKKERLIRGGEGTEVLGAVLFLLLASLLAAKFGVIVAEALSGRVDSPPFDSLRSYTYAIPFAALALVTSLLFRRSVALLVAVVFSLLVGRMVGGDALWAVIYTLAGSLAAIYSLDRFSQRSQVTRAGIVVGVVNMATCVMLSTFSDQPVASGASLGFDLLCAFVGGVLVAAAASFALPILETLLSVTTDIKLLELSDTNLPLLRRLAFEAPGTFQHSLMVANLAKVGCESIGANPVLAYTGGLYHDIGKVFRPNYFVENQQPGHNLHDKLAPSMSSLIVISHVKEGVELAREGRLPQPIIDAIEQHHGTRKLTFFYKRAQEQAGSEEESVPEEGYRYAGPKPASKVMGVLMYADAVEAASRTLTNPTSSKVRTLLRTILDDCLDDGQFDQTDLTLNDLHRVSEAFRRVLETIFHKRVDYPGFDFNEEGREPQLRVLDGARS